MEDSYDLLQGTIQANGKKDWHEPRQMLGEPVTWPQFETRAPPEIQSGTARYSNLHGRNTKAKIRS